MTTKRRRMNLWPGLIIIGFAMSLLALIVYATTPVLASECPEWPCWDKPVVKSPEKSILVAPGGAREWRYDQKRVMGKEKPITPPSVIVLKPGPVKYAFFYMAPDGFHDLDIYSKESDCDDRARYFAKDNSTIGIPPCYPMTKAEAEYEKWLVMVQRRK